MHLIKIFNIAVYPRAYNYYYSSVVSPYLELQGATQYSSREGAWDTSDMGNEVMIIKGGTTFCSDKILRQKRPRPGVGMIVLYERDEMDSIAKSAHPILLLSCVRT